MRQKEMEARLTELSSCKRLFKAVASNVHYSFLNKAYSATGNALKNQGHNESLLKTPKNILNDQMKHEHKLIETLK